METPEHLKHLKRQFELDDLRKERERMLNIKKDVVKSVFSEMEAAEKGEDDDLDDL